MKIGGPTVVVHLYSSFVRGYRSLAAQHEIGTQIIFLFTSVSLILYRSTLYTTPSYNALPAPAMSLQN